MHIKKHCFKNAFFLLKNVINEHANYKYISCENKIK